MTGTLFIVSTPIGNLQDITLRAIKTLKEADFIACEDTRTASFLLKSAGIEFVDFKDKIFSYYEQNENQRNIHIINLLSNGKNVALISESGTPAISDPGFKLIREVLNRGIKVESIPGPSSVMSAIVSSGLPTDKFVFLGFLPKKIGHRETLLKKLKNSLSLIEATVIIFESPFRLQKTLVEIKTVFGDIDIVIIRELTKIHEERKKDKISNLLKQIEKGVKGEIVILFNLK
ncbi:MAG: 16S rRNA (cytidine(1402)-2'-O)-methyltransferase [Candidatus Levybacteria bacterium CG10_big_fil_rev_8_21_14_0_10_35_13]|nr:MAG: 16S rRNA (cytidine(1402)-2'-O)-methyltransferase [Candidatus Levybacteria bacterium CG10_big_fil_rev_8_21_14_0_10_35_13]